MSDFRIEDLLWQVTEAATCLMCARSTHCSSPDDCLRWAADSIAAANRMLANNQARVTVIERGSGRITEVTDEALLLVALDGAGVVTVSSVDVHAR